MMFGRSAALAALVLSAISLPPLAAAQPPAEPRVLAKIFPNASSGKPIPQLGIGGWNYWSYEEPFINLAKASAPSFTARFADGTTMSWSELWAAGHIDKATLYPKSIPAGAYLFAGIYRFGAITLPSAFGGTYVLEWDGDADLRLASRDCTGPAETNCQVVINSNRLEATFSASLKEYSFWTINRIGPTGVSNIRLYRKENESALNSGKILNPKFQALARRYKILRFMEPQESSFARPFHAGNFVSGNAAAYAVDIFPAPADAPREINFATLFKVALEASTAAWVHVVGLPGTTPDIDALPRGIIADPWPVNLQWMALCKANLDTILASPDWAAHMDAVVDGLQSTDYPRRWMLYLEGWNEVWNTAQPWDHMTYCAKGVSDKLGQGESASYGYGYLTAHAMVAMDAALKRQGRRQAWTMVLAQQAASPFTTSRALDGFKRYFADRGVDPAPWLKHVGVSVQGYYFGSMERETGFITAASDAEHLAKLKAAILGDPAGTAKARADWLISSNGFGSIGFAALRRSQHQQLAEEAGAYFLGDFEGESHEVLAPYLRADPVVVNWAEKFITGPEGERVTRAWVAAMVAQNPNAVASNFQAILQLDPEGDDPADANLAYPWFDGYYGEVNGRTRGLATMLRPF